MAQAAPKSLKTMVLRWMWLPIMALSIAALLRLVDLDQVGQALATANLWNLAAMLGFWLVWLAARPLRMRLLLQATAPATPVGYNDAYGAHVLGNAINSLIPMRAGEFAMLWVLARRARVPIPASLSAVVLDRLCDVVSALVVLVWAILVMPNPPHSLVEGVEIFAALLVVGVVLMALAVRLRKRALALAAMLLPQRWHGAALHRIDDLLQGLGVLARPAVLVRAVALSGLIWALAVLSFAAGIGAVWPDATVPMGAFTVGVVAVAFLVPAAPGGIGVFHAAIVFALSFYGVPAATALAYALVSHLSTFLAGLAAAALWTLWNGLDPREIARSPQPPDA
jgi:glycosyltransferase 2 family protein